MGRPGGCWEEVGMGAHPCQTCAPRKEQIPGPAVAAQQIPSKAPSLSLRGAPPPMGLGSCSVQGPGLGTRVPRPGPALTVSVTKEKQMCDQPTKQKADVPPRINSSCLCVEG